MFACKNKLQLFPHLLGRRERCTREGRYSPRLTRPRAVPTSATSTMTAVAAYVLGVSSSAPARKLLQIPLIPGDVVDTPQDQLPTADTSEGVESLASAFDSGDTAWMLTSTALVLLMAIPGLAPSTAGSCVPRTCSTPRPTSSPSLSSPSCVNPEINVSNPPTRSCRSSRVSAHVALPAEKRTAPTRRCGSCGATRSRSATSRWKRADTTSTRFSDPLPTGASPASPSSRRLATTPRPSSSRFTACSPA